MELMERLLDNPETIARNRAEFNLELLPDFYNVFEHIQGYKPCTGDKVLLKRHIIETWHFHPREIYTIVEEFFRRFHYEPRRENDIPEEYRYTPPRW